MTVSASAQFLYDNDPTTAAFGIQLVSASSEGSVVTMTVRPEMCNGFGIIHGGMTALLADSAMAFASNSDNQQALAMSATVDWLAPARPGQILTATARRSGGGKRSAIWDITVTADDGTPIALFRGRTRKSTTPLIPNP